MEKPLIMLVDDSRTNLLAGKTALADLYAVMTLPSGQKLLETLEWKKPALILLDVEMPDLDGFATLDRLKRDPAVRDIPVIFLTAKSEAESELEGLRLGAVDYITKPFSPPLLRKRVELHLLLEAQRLSLQQYSENLEEMVQARTRTILNLQSKLLTAMAEIIEGRDKCTGAHVANTQRYLRTMMAAVLEGGHWPEQTANWDVDLIVQSSQLHDIGKIGIDDAILKKPGPLTAEEFVHMKRHVDLGREIIERLMEGDEEDSLFLAHAKVCVTYHHEKWDGTGYPGGVAGEDIPLLGRLMALVDVYDALLSERPYKRALSRAEALGIIAAGRGKHFDPTLADIFVRLFKEGAPEAAA
ncbi:two-component system response regulator [Deltaproteobacteria bacterium]|nr:two-component system response regulator [Deltaproteobacteria bacterium]